MSSLIITGANGGLGRAVTERMLNDGYHIIATTGRTGAGNLPEHERLETVSVDLLEEAKAGTFISETVKKHADISGAILLVGGFAMGKFTETSKESLEKMISLNFYSAFNIVKPLLKHFSGSPDGGRFILIGSRPGLESAAGKDFFAYSLSKAMIFKLAEFINAEGRDKNIVATVIVPSTIDTEANRRAMPGADFSKWVPASEIAAAISFYLSPAGRMTREGIVKIYNRS